MNWYNISNEFIKEFNVDIPETNWLYKDREYKMKQIKDCELYEEEGDYIIDDIGALVQKNNKIRCFNLQIVEKI